MQAMAFTVDLDRDVNEPCRGVVSSRSCDRGRGDAPRFRSSRRGMLAICDLLEELGIKATVFAESRTLREMGEDAACLEGHEIASHGVDHEDLTGERTGVVPSREEIRDIVSRGMEELEELTGRRPIGFRAPYLNVDRRVLEVVGECGFAYDSSYSLEMCSGLILPIHYPNGIWELPLAEGRDRRGRRISSYLWPMHEGRRELDEYLRLVDSFRVGLFVMATHSWHPAESYRGGIRDDEGLRAEMEKVRKILEHALDLGLEFRTLGHAFSEAQRIAQSRQYL